jgi:hypothetical protein
MLDAAHTDMDFSQNASQYLSNAVDDWFLPSEIRDEVESALADRYQAAAAESQDDVMEGLSEEELAIRAMSADLLDRGYLSESEAMQLLAFKGL